MIKTVNSFYPEINEELFESIIEQGGIDVSKIVLEREKAVDFLTDRMIENKSYKNRDLAQKNANLFVTALEKLSETSGISIEDLIREESPVIKNNSKNGADKTIYRQQLFQSADSAGAANNAQISAVQKEWKEKGTESSYFKNWFGSSKVVDKNGKPLVVYHGTNAEFDIFDKNKIGQNLDGRDKEGLRNQKM